MAVATSAEQVLPDLLRLRCLFVNVYFWGEDAHWTLIDGGLPTFDDNIVDAAEKRFGKDAAPEAIILTHGQLPCVQSSRPMQPCLCTTKAACQRRLSGRKSKILETKKGRRCSTRALDCGAHAVRLQASDSPARSARFARLKKSAPAASIRTILTPEKASRDR